MKQVVKDYLGLGLLAGIIVTLDQWTKSLVEANIAFGDFWSPWPWLTDYARIVHWKNTGAAFGILQNFGGVFTMLSLVIAVAILYYYPQVPREERILRLAMGLQLGGALGNLIDRLTQGYVTDFISVGNFAVFNIADASISTGVAVLILGIWIKDRQSGRPADAPGDDQPESPVPAPQKDASLD